MAYDNEFIEGFDKYGPVGGSYLTNGLPSLLAMLLAGEWTSFLTFGGGAPHLELSIVPPLSGPAAGTALQIVCPIGSFGAETYLSKTLSASYARIIAGYKVQFGTPYAGFCVAHNGVAQLTIFALPSGQVQINLGSMASGTPIAVTAQSRPIGSTFELEFDFTIAPSSGGKVAVWFDGTITSVNATGVTTSADGSSAFNQAGPGAASLGSAVFDHLYEHLFLAGGSGDLPLLTAPIVETGFATGDVSVQFASQQSVIGQPFIVSGSSPAFAGLNANYLFLRQFTPPVQMSLEEVGWLPASSSSTVNFKPALYADSAGAPGALIATGPQVTGCTNGVPVIAALTTPQVLTGGTPYWIGFILDTTLNFYQVIGENLATSADAPNTYTSGAPNPAPTMTYNHADFVLWGICNSATANWPNVGLNPPAVPASLGILLGPGNAFNQSSTVNQQDLFSFPALVGSPTYIYTSAIKVLGAVPAGGTRDLNCVMKSGGTTGLGSNSEIPMSASFLWLSSYFDDDPNTSAAWGTNISAFNAADSGYSIFS